MLLRVSRAAWRLAQAERERSWALASARAEGVSIRTLAAAVRLSSSRVHQIVAAVGIDELARARRVGDLGTGLCRAPRPSPSCSHRPLTQPPGSWASPGRRSTPLLRQAARPRSRWVSMSISMVPYRFACD